MTANTRQRVLPDTGGIVTLKYKEPYMNKHASLLAVMLLLSANALVAQKTHTATKPPPKTSAPVEIVIKDTFAWNVQTTLKRLQAYILDDTKSSGYIVGEYMYTNSDLPFYATAIKMPGALSSRVIRHHVNRALGYVEWEWQAQFLRTTKEQEEQRAQIETIIKAMPAMRGGDEKNKVTSIAAVVNPYSYVEISVHFLKPVLQTKQQATDSLIAVFHPGFIRLETAEDAAKKFWKATEAEGIAEDDVKEAMTKEIRAVADMDTRAAYQVMMSTPRPQDLMSKLTPQQAETIRAYANGYLEAYKNGTSFDVKTYDPNPPRQPGYDNNSSYNTGKGVFAPAPQPEGTKVRCAVCSGTGQYEKVTYSHTYNGISGNITTQVTHWVICEFCNGTGWVMKYKK